MLTTLLILALLLGLAMLALLFFARSIEHKLVYFPEPAYGDSPARLGLPFEDITLSTADGETLRAWYLPAAPNAAGPGVQLLFCHGNAGSRERRLDNLAGLHHAGIAVLIFDYRGYGGSSGSPSEQGVITDGMAAYDWLAARFPEQPVVAFGRSLGGAVAAQVALRRPIAGMILESTFTSAKAMAPRVLPLPGVTWFVRHRFDTRAALSEITQPLLIIHGTRDELVPYDMGEALFAAAVSPHKTFHAVPGGQHNDTYAVAGNDYYRWLLDFLQEVEAQTGKP